MNVNLHTHTYRCHHAKGTPEEYIEKALEAGYTHLGFSDHMPFVFPDGTESHFRVPMAEAEDYMAELKELREEYKDRITLHIGFEMEYYPLFFKEMISMANQLGAEYLLLGQHYIHNEYPGGRGNHLFKPKDRDEDMIVYADTVCEGMATGVFTYVAHPDVIHFTGSDTVFREQSRRICEASLQYDLPLELNFTGVHEDHRTYPDARFWEIAGELGCKTVFGCDAHSVEAVYHTETLEKAEQYAKSFGLKVVEFPELIHPKTGKRTPTA